MSRSLAEWLDWQSGLSPRDIELGLERSIDVAARLSLRIPRGRVFTIAGTNGKGSTAAFLQALLAKHGWRTGVYTSPHLVRYNERIEIAGEAIADEALIQAFETVELARAGVPLTFFEFGTLAALAAFSAADLDAWVLEVGLGGRLDAVNGIDPDFSLITTIALDHQDWLGDSLESIAAEKAGILRAGRPGFFGGQPAPRAILETAATAGADLRLAGRDFGWERSDDSWSWHDTSQALPSLPLPVPGDDSQLDNFSLALAAAACCEPALVNRDAVSQACALDAPAGRFQQLRRHEREWVLDVAHNPQAAGVLAGRLQQLPPAPATTVILGLHDTKDLGAFLAPLAAGVSAWICCRAGDRAGREPAALAAEVAHLTGQRASHCEHPEDAVAQVLQTVAPGGRILVCGSFEVVGPVLAALD